MITPHHHMSEVDEAVFTAAGAQFDCPPADNSGAAQLGVAGENGRGSIHQGMLEGSNVNVVEELVDMIETQRAYEVNSKMISATDEMMKNASQTL